MNELFERIAWLASPQREGDAVTLLYMHETLVQICHEGIRETRQGFGNLFAQVDYLCRHHNISVPDTIEIQTARRHSNQHAPIGHDELLYDCRALAILASAILHCDVPSAVVALIPAVGRAKPEARHIDFNALRVASPVMTEGGALMVRMDDGEQRIVNLSEEHQYLQRIVRGDMQLSLVDVHEEDNGTLSPRFIIVEPDFLLDISSLARCFQDYGHHPLSYMVNRMSPSANSQAILLGNYAGALLDASLAGNAGENLWAETLVRHFADEALQYATCPDFNQAEYKKQCQQQASNIRSIMKEIGKTLDDSSNVILEPSFVCPALGLQGRVDMMTEDMRLLVEQKSGKNWNIERNQKGMHGALQKEEHYVQLLLYFAVLHQNFNIPLNKLDIRLMYSRYPLPHGLLVVNYYQQLLQEAFMVRNRIVASAMYFAREGFTPQILHSLTPRTLNENKLNSNFYHQYIERQHIELLAPLHSLTALEEAYFCRMVTFLYREQAVGMIGVHEGTTHGMADIWNMPFAEKVSQGEILLGTCPDNNTERCQDITIGIDGCEQTNLRKGDSIYLYKYKKDSIPDATRAILYKGSIVELTPTAVTVHLNDTQNLGCADDEAWALEHSSSSSGLTSGLRALYMLMSASKERRDLLLGQTVPRTDSSIQLSRSYHPSYDDVLLAAKQAQDYYLLVGPPGTGKTSMAMKFMVLEELGSRRNPSDSILLTSYTNRAVDEICGMLEEAGVDYLRIGNIYSCDPRFRGRLASQMFAELGRLDKINNAIASVPVVVATTSTLMSHPEIFRMKTFSLTIVDEASQILEPSIIGLLAQLGKFVLIGDHKQLPAVVQQSEEDSAVSDALLQGIALTNCRNSLFERLNNWLNVTGASPQSVGILRKQGRMHPEVAMWPNRMFYREEELQPVPLPHQEEESLAYTESSADAVDDLLKQHRMLFFDVRNSDADDAVLDVKSNKKEASMCADLVMRVRRQLGDRWDAVKTVGIIVPYRNQIAMIRREIEAKAKARGYDTADFSQISIDTVERYQGSQREVIIYSFTISKAHQLEFLTSSTFICGDYAVDRKLNVALTRARRQMLMVGNAQLLRRVPLFDDLIQVSHVQLVSEE